MLKKIWKYLLNKPEFKPSLMSTANDYYTDKNTVHSYLPIYQKLFGHKDLKNILDNCSDNSKLEIIVQGSVELMKSRNRLFTKKESKKLKNNTDDIFLIDKKNKRYPIHKSLSNEEIIISNSEDISLLNDITYLKSIGLVNFAIDGRWRDENYLNKIQEYNTAIDK